MESDSLASLDFSNLLLILASTLNYVHSTGFFFSLDLSIFFSSAVNWWAAQILIACVTHTQPDIAPVLEGAVQHIASKRFEIGGVDLTKLLAQELRKSNPLVKIDVSEVEKLKEQYAVCAEDSVAYEEAQKSSPAERHTLPDGQVCSRSVDLIGSLNFLEKNLTRWTFRPLLWRVWLFMRESFVWIPRQRWPLFKPCFRIWLAPCCFVADGICSICILKQHQSINQFSMVFICLHSPRSSINQWVKQVPRNLCTFQAHSRTEPPLGQP